MPPNVAVEIELSDEERAQLEAWRRRRTSAQALAQRSRIVLAAAEGLKNTEIAERVGVSRNTAATWRVAVCRAPPRRADRRAAAGASANDHRRAGRRGDHQDAGEHARRTRRTGRRARWPPRSASRRRRCRGSGGRSACNPPPGDLQALQGPAVRREGPRRRRALSQPARARRRALRRREVPDPGARSHRADLADAPRRPRARHPRLPARRHLKPLRRAGPDHRQGHRRVALPPPRDRVQAVPADDRPRGPRPISPSTSCSTTAARTRPRRSATGCSRTLASSCTSPQPELLAEPRRALVRRAHQQATQTRHPPLRPRSQHRHPRLDQHLERQPPPLRLDQDRRADPRLDPPATANESTTHDTRAACAASRRRRGSPRAGSPCPGAS